MESAPTLSVVVVTYESAAFLPALAASLRPELEALPGGSEVVVVDNASRDDSARVAREAFPGAAVLVNGRNAGYGSAANRGWGATRAPRVLVMNPDVVVHPGALAALLRASGSFPEAAVIAPRLLNTDGSLQPSCRRFYTPATVLLQRTALGRLGLGRRAVRRHLMGDLDLSRSHQVDWVTGAVMLVHRGAVPEAGPFDPRFFLYFEDVDLCYRVRREGWITLYVPEAAMTHHHGRRSRAPSPWNADLRHHLVSYGRFLAKWGASPGV